MKRLAAWLAACGIGVASAQAPAAARWYLQVDNDFFFDTDRWYSSGVRLARVAGAGPDATEWALEQDVWTPEGKRFTPGTVDRAPTARLGGRFAWHHADAAVFQTVELGLGVRGRGAQGERTTTAVHHVFSAAEVDWSREVPSELDASAAITRTHAVGPFALHYGVAAGNELAFAHAGIEWRTGSETAVYSPLMRHVATPPFAIGSSGTGWNGFVGASLRAVARNRLLDRAYDASTPDPSRKDAVLRGVAGVSWLGPWGGLVFALALDSREFAQQRVPQPFGSVVLHLAF